MIPGAAVNNGGVNMTEAEFQETIRAAKAEAWDEGYGQGKAAMVKLMSPTHFATEADNPYRSAK